MNVYRLRHSIGAAVCVATTVLLVACGSSSPAGTTSVPLKVVSISPSTASTTGGKPVTISGTGFGSDAMVSIGGVPATGVTVSGSTSIMAVTAPRATAGSAEVAVTSGGKTSTLTSGFMFVAPSGANRPPVIGSFRSIGSRNNQPSGFVDIDETVQVLATVTDAEASAAALTYDWTGPGTLTSSGSTV